MQKLGIPYSNAQIDQADQSLRQQAETLTKDLAGQGVTVAWDSEMVALISYLQRLKAPGGEVKTAPAEPGSAPSALEVP